MILETRIAVVIGKNQGLRTDPGGGPVRTAAKAPAQTVQKNSRATQGPPMRSTGPGMEDEEEERALQAVLAELAEAERELAETTRKQEARLAEEERETENQLRDITEKYERHRRFCLMGMA